MPGVQRKTPGKRRTQRRGLARRADQPADARRPARPPRDACAISAAAAAKPRARPTSASASEVSAVTASMRGGGTRGLLRPARCTPHRGPEHLLPAGGVHREVRRSERARCRGGGLSTVLGMSCSLRSRNTAAPSARNGLDRGRAVLHEERQPDLHHAHRGRQQRPQAARLVERHVGRPGDALAGLAHFAGELPVDDLLELVDGLRAVQEDAVDEERRRAAHPGREPGLLVGIDRLLLVARVEALTELLRRPARPRWRAP